MNQAHRRRLITGATAVACLLVVSGGVFYFTGGYDSWRDDRSLSSACKGVLDAGALRSALDSDEVRAHQGAVHFPDSEAGLLTHCQVADRNGDGSIEIAVRWGSKAERMPEALHHQSLDDIGIVAVPIGRKWPGSVVSDGRWLSGAVELTCRNKPNERLVVNVHELLSTARHDTRTHLARVATTTAANAADEFGCDARLGGPVERVAPGTEWKPVPMSKASGSCAALNTLASHAGRQGAHAVLEGPKDPDALVEDCYLAGDKSTPIFRFTALYGTFAENTREKPETLSPVPGDSGQESPRAWATAPCQGGPKALYTVTTVPHGEPKSRSEVPEFERQALKAFAERSAELHGCEKPQTP
ncbi:hypothetical protein ACZ90_63520 [Streptomyces albus subsp. albus]|nr:hypothetical protein ACZ90_63520 [Streptomyces albus subsp. albus]